MIKRKLAGVMAAATLITGVAPMTAQAADNFDLRKRVIGLVGIMNVDGTEQQVTRGQFAYMLVMASSYSSTLSNTCNVSVFNDVPKTHQYASAIKTAVEQGWMTGYLGGLFKPDQNVTLQEAIRGVLALLGYTNEDFSGDQTGGRYAKYCDLELNDEITREQTEVLDKADCINLFYNLLKADTKSGSVYGQVLGCELTSDGEINPLTLADNSLKGPKLVRRNHSLSDYIPFDLDTANVFLDGEASTVSALKSYLANDYLVVYWNSRSKTVWAYTTESDETNHKVARGTIDNIFYGSTDVMTPSAVTIDGEEYQLSSSEMQFVFSIYGDLKVGDTVAVIYTESEDSNGNVTKTVLDYVEY